MSTPMTAAQGRYLSTLLDRHPTQRPRAHREWHQGTLDKARASEWIDALKQGMAPLGGRPVAKAPSAPVQPPARPDATPVATSQREAAERLQGAAYKRKAKGPARRSTSSLAAMLCPTVTEADLDGCPF